MSFDRLETLAPRSPVSCRPRRNPTPQISSANGTRRNRQINIPKARPRFEAKSDRRFADRLANVLQSGRGVPHDRQQPVEKQRRDGGAHANSEKRHRHEQREESERRNSLDRAGKSEDHLPDDSASTGGDAQWNADRDREKQRQAGELQMTRRPTPELVRKGFGAPEGLGR